MTVASLPAAQSADPALTARSEAGPPVISFITLRTAGRACLFGEVVQGNMRLSELGCLVRAEWLRLGFGRPGVRLHEFVIMPNHFHALVELTPQPALPHSLGALVAGFKAGCAVQINHRRQTPGGAVWQRNYDERIIRDSEMLLAVRRHIEENPRRWWDRQLRNLRSTRAAR
ncbi:MAG TPA: transposase [Gemmatimonadales bacterium]|nr:transposase [Gemmatimonadales bacterium]